ncbi:MAG: four helix bundle protein [Algibacter sp.]|uniref:four helix bundle protein n=1 Tax=Algibacter sp. TaxID=1872428 RepID=UPI003299769F
MSKFKFEKVLIWQKAMDLGKEINLLIDNFPKKEYYNLSSPLIRAVDSVPLKISEGAIVQSNPEQNKFLGYSIQSLAKVVTCVYKAIRRKYISEEQFNTYYEESFYLMNMMIAFKRNLK